MRIVRLRIRNFRGVAECDVRFATDGVTIVEGPNEVGKTSLAEAIDLLLNERDDSTKRSVRAIRSVGRDVGAEAEIEMVTGPYRFVYRKCWHRQRRTELDVLEPVRIQLTGREAHDRVREILDETLDADLWEALRLRQGTQLEQAQFAGGSLGRALDVAAGGDGTGDREDDLWVRVTAERDRYWTATWQQRSDRTALQAELTTATSLVATVEEALRELQDDADEVARLGRSMASLVERRHQQTELERVLAEQFTAIERQRNEIDLLRSARDTARADRDRAREIAGSRAVLVGRVAAASDVVRELGSTSASAVPALAAAEARLLKAVEATRDGRARVAAADVDHRRAVGDETYRRQEIELSQLSERSERVRSAIRRRSVAQAVLDGNMVDDEAVARVQVAFMEVTLAEATASTGASVIQLRASADVVVRSGGEEVELVPGDEHRLVISDSIAIDVPGILHLAVTAGTEAKSAGERVAAARTAFVAACATIGVDDVAGAQVAAEARKEALRSVAAADRTIADDLRDLTVEALEHKIASLRARIDAYGSERSAEPPLPADLDRAHDRAVDGDLELQALRAELSRLESDEAEAAEVVRGLQVSGAGIRANLEQARALEEREAASLAVARQEASDDEITGRLARAEALLAASDAALQSAEDGLRAEHPDTVESRLAAAREVLQRLADELHEQDARTRALRTKLEVKGEEGLAQQLDAAKSAVARLTARHDSLEARAAAARTLYEAFAARRAEAHRRYVAPFRDQIEGLARIVFGPTIEIELDDELRIARRTLDGVTLEFADLSTGAKEQLGMIGRLACASIVSDDGGAPVIFDDALGWSDPTRLDGMGAVIRMAGRSCQIIILTCTPGRYAGVGNAEVVRLGS